MTKPAAGAAVPTHRLKVIKLCQFEDMLHPTNTRTSYIQCLFVLSAWVPESFFQQQLQTTRPGRVEECVWWCRFRGLLSFYIYIHILCFFLILFVFLCPICCSLTVVTSGEQVMSGPLTNYHASSSNCTRNSPKLVVNRKHLQETQSWW